MRCLLLLPLLLPSPAFAIPNIVLVQIYDDVHPSASGDYRTTSATHPEDIPARWLTPKLDAMANAGVRMNNLHVQSVCSPTRAELLGWGAVGQASNPFGNIQLDGGAMELAPSGAELINAYKQAGYTVAGFGKLHTGRNQLANNFSTETWAKQIGFDVYEGMITRNSGRGGVCETLRKNPTTCWGHNYWCKGDLAGNFTIEGDGTSVIGGTNGFSSAIIESAATAYINAAIIEGGKYLIIVGWNSTHKPFKDGDNNGGAADCDYDDDSILDDFQDDRIPGSVADDDGIDGQRPIYGEMVQDLDTRVGNLNALLHLGTGAPNHLALAVSDNGVMTDGSGPKCLAAAGQKATPYPCGTDAIAVWQGDDITAGPLEMAGLFDATDVSKTLIHLVNGTQRRPGMTFADCLTGNNGRSVSNCPDRKYVMSHEFSPLGGGTLTDGTPTGANTLPPKAGDPANEWTTDEYGVITSRCGGKKFFLHREYDASIIITETDFCEHFYEITVADPYLKTANVILETTCTPGSFTGAIATSGLTADQSCAYDILNRAATVRHLRGNFAPSIGGGSR